MRPTERIVPIGFTMPFPEMSGADPVDVSSAFRGPRLRITRVHTVNRLVDTIAAGAIWDAAQRRRREKTDRARDDGRLIGDDVTEQVARHDDTVECAGVLNHQHGRRVDEVVSDLQLGELLCHHLRHDLTPQTRRRKHIRLVERPHRQGWVRLHSQVSREADDALDLRARVDLRVPGDSVTSILLALAKVQTTRQLADDVEVGAAADVGLERGDFDERVGCEVARPQVAVGLHLLAQLQDALFGAHGAGTPFGAADGAEEDGVCGFGGGEGFGCEGGAVSIDGALGGWLVVARNGVGSADGILTPPRRCSWKLKWPTLGRTASTTLRICEDSVRWCLCEVELRRCSP